MTSTPPRCSPTWLGVLACACLTWCVQPGRAGPIYTFTPISNNSGVSAALGPQLSVEVLGMGDANLNQYGASLTSSQVLFVFRNNVGIASSITQIYFQDGANVLDAFSSSPIFQSSGVSYSTTGVSPPNLPGGNSINPNFTTTSGLSAGPTSPTSQNGINASTEWLGLRINLENNISFNDVLAALDKPLTGNQVTGLRIGLHVQSIQGDQSDSFINGTTSIIPVPPSAVLFGIGALGLFVRWRRSPRAA